MASQNARMSRGGLSVIDASAPDVCGAETSDGGPCQHPAGEDGRCWLPGHKDAPEVGPPPPSHLGDVGKQHWNETIRWISGINALDAVDLALVEQMCEMYEARRQCQRAIAELGVVVRGRRGEEKKNPAAAKFKSYSTEYRLCRKELRKQVEAAGRKPEDADDPLADW